MKLSDLAEKAEIQEDIPIIKDGTRRPIGGTLGVRIRLKTPLVKKDVRVTIEKILVIDGAFPNIAPPTTTSTPTPTKTTTTPATPSTPVTPSAKTPATATPTSAKNPATPTTTPTPTAPTSKPAAPAQTPAQAAKPAAGAAQKPAAAAAQKPAAQAQAQGGDDELDLDDVNSVDNMISNDVLESEQAAVDAQIAAYSQKKQPIPEALVDRKQAIELKMSILVIQVQTEMLQGKVQEERALAKKLVGLGKKEWARFPLQRAKLMESEIESASAGDDE